jgi:hypothetical protein
MRKCGFRSQLWHHLGGKMHCKHGIDSCACARKEIYLDVEKHLLNGGGRDWGWAPTRHVLARAGLQMRGIEILHARPCPRPPCRRTPHRRCSVPDTARGGDLGGGRGWAGRGPRPRWCRGPAEDPTARESTARASRRRGARLGPVVLDAGRPPSRVTEKSATGVAGKRRRRGNQPVGEEMEQRRWAATQGWAAMVGSGGWRPWRGPVGEERGEMKEPERLRKIN